MLFFDWPTVKLYNCLMSIISDICFFKAMFGNLLTELHEVAILCWSNIKKLENLSRPITLNVITLSHNSCESQQANCVLNK